MSTSKNLCQTCQTPFDARDQEEIARLACLPNDKKSRPDAASCFILNEARGESCCVDFFLGDEVWLKRVRQLQKAVQDPVELLAGQMQQQPVHGPVGQTMLLRPGFALDYCFAMGYSLCPEIKRRLDEAWTLTVRVTEVASLALNEALDEETDATVRARFAIEVMREERGTKHKRSLRIDVDLPRPQRARFRWPQRGHTARREGHLVLRGLHSVLNAVEVKPSKTAAKSWEAHMSLNLSTGPVHVSMHVKVLHCYFDEVYLQLASLPKAGKRCITLSGLLAVLMPTLELKERQTIFKTYCQPLRAMRITDSLQPSTTHETLISQCIYDIDLEEEAKQLYLDCVRLLSARVIDDAETLQDLSAESWCKLNEPCVSIQRSQKYILMVLARLFMGVTRHAVDNIMEPVEATYEDTNPAEVALRVLHSACAEQLQIFQSRWRVARERMRRADLAVLEADARASVSSGNYASGEWRDGDASFLAGRDAERDAEHDAELAEEDTEAASHTSAEIAWTKWLRQSREEADLCPRGLSLSWPMHEMSCPGCGKTATTCPSNKDCAPWSFSEDECPDCHATGASCDAQGLARCHSCQHTWPPGALQCPACGARGPVCQECLSSGMCWQRGMKDVYSIRNRNVSLSGVELATLNAQSVADNVKVQRVLFALAAHLAGTGPAQYANISAAVRKGLFEAKGRAPFCASTAEPSIQAALTVNTGIAATTWTAPRRQSSSFRDGLDEVDWTHEKTPMKTRIQAYGRWWAPPLPLCTREAWRRIVHEVCLDALSTAVKKREVQTEPTTSTAFVHTFMDLEALTSLPPMSLQTRVLEVVAREVSKAPQLLTLKQALAFPALFADSLRDTMRNVFVAGEAVRLQNRKMPLRISGVRVSFSLFGRSEVRTIRKPFVNGCLPRPLDTIVLLPAGAPATIKAITGVLLSDSTTELEMTPQELWTQRQDLPLWSFVRPIFNERQGVLDLRTHGGYAVTLYRTRSEAELRDTHISLALREGFVQWQSREMNAQCPAGVVASGNCWPASYASVGAMGQHSPLGLALTNPPGHCVRQHNILRAAKAYTEPGSVLSLPHHSVCRALGATGGLLVANPYNYALGLGLPIERKATHLLFVAYVPWNWPHVYEDSMGFSQRSVRRLSLSWMDYKEHLAPSALPQQQVPRKELEHLCDPLYLLHLDKSGSAHGYVLKGMPLRFYKVGGQLVPWRAPQDGWVQGFVDKQGRIKVLMLEEYFWTSGIKVVGELQKSVLSLIWRFPYCGQVLNATRSEKSLVSRNTPGTKIWGLLLEYALVLGYQNSVKMSREHPQWQHMTAMVTTTCELSQITEARAFAPGLTLGGARRLTDVDGRDLGFADVLPSRHGVPFGKAAEKVWLGTMKQGYMSARYGALGRRPQAREATECHLNAAWLEERLNFEPGVAQTGRKSSCKVVEDYLKCGNLSLEISSMEVD